MVAIDADADPVLLDRLIDAATPGGRGIAVLCLDPPNLPATQLAIDTDGTLHIPHLGLEARAVSLDVDQLDRIDHMLANEPTTPPR